MKGFVCECQIKKKLMRKLISAINACVTQYEMVVFRVFFLACRHNTRSKRSMHTKYKLNTYQLKTKIIDYNGRKLKKKDSKKTREILAKYTVIVRLFLNFNVFK